MATISSDAMCQQPKDVEKAPSGLGKMKEGARSLKIAFSEF
jgi:hypothetical protein